MEMWAHLSTYLQGDDKLKIACVTTCSHHSKLLLNEAKRTYIKEASKKLKRSGFESRLFIPRLMELTADEFMNEIKLLTDSQSIGLYQKHGFKAVRSSTYADRRNQHPLCKMLR